MKAQLLVIVFWTLLELPVLMSSLSGPHDFYLPLADSSVVIAYSRFAEIEKHCSSFLSSASELKPDENRGFRLRNELSFYYGDWEQENDGAPLMQLNENGIQKSSQSFTSPLKLASFQVKDVNSVQHFKNAVSLGGVLSLGISRGSSALVPTVGEPYMNASSSAMMIDFEGIYVETKDNGGERLLCLLGNSTSTLPSTNNCESYISSNGNYRLRYLEDDQILLVLRYPKTFTLTRRAIRGEMTSLNEQGGSKYFSKVYVSSHLSGHSKYQFDSGLLQSRTFDPSPYQDELMEDGAMMFTAGDFCRGLEHLPHQEILNIFPNYRFRGNYMSQIHGKLGPFLLWKEIEATAGMSYDDIKLIFQHVKCEQDANSNETGNAKVSAVLRLAPRGSYEDLEVFRTGLSGLTLAAEGIWNSSSGQLFMVGCQGMVDSGLEGCDYEIAMYFPRAFSIKQRNFLFGSMSSVKKGASLDNPLFFSAIKSSRDLEYLSYNYSKINLVNVLGRRSLPDQILAILKLWLFQYPAMEDAKEPHAQLSLLSGSLAINGYAVSDQLTDEQKSRVWIETEVLSLGPSFGRYEPEMEKRNLWKKPVITKNDLKCRFLNVSMHLALRNQKGHKQTNYKNVSELSLEGLYDPVLGEMHLIGCRRALVTSISIERGQDCLIEVKIQYPPKNFRWWRNPTAKITITSQRQEDDPLYFSLISLHAILDYYPDSIATVADRESFEGILCILMLCGSIAIIWMQLSYMKKDAYIVPYISTSMLTAQILGYSLPLISGAKVLFKSKESESYRAGRNHPSFGMLKVLACFENVLLLLAFLLSARLSQMVTDSRTKPHSKETSKLRYASKEKRVILSTMAIYTLASLIWLAARDDPDVSLQPRKGIDSPTNVLVRQSWMTAVEDHVYFLQDFFLLPQILSNLLTPTPVKSLREAYYLGFTSIRLLVHLFDHMKDPTLHTKVGRYESMSRNSTSPLFFKFVAPTIIITNAIIVHIQQNWKHKKHMQG